MTPITKIQADESDKRFLISAKWWHEWCNYTGFNEAQLFDAKYEVPDHEEGMPYLTEEQLYNKPGPICNEVLLRNQSQAKASVGHSGLLKENLVLHFDYVYVTKEVWNHLYSWYSADYTIFRYLKPMKMPGQKRVLDLNQITNAFQISQA